MNKVEKIPKVIDPMKMKLIVIQVFTYSSTIRNPVVAPTGMGKKYGRIMPLLR